MLDSIDAEGPPARRPAIQARLARAGVWSFRSSFARSTAASSGRGGTGQRGIENERVRRGPRSGAANVDRRCRAVEQLIESDELIRRFSRRRRIGLVELSNSCAIRCAGGQLGPCRSASRSGAAALPPWKPRSAEMVAGRT